LFTASHEDNGSMTPDKKRRIATATGFLSGVLACMDALREVTVSWPPEAVWAAMRRPHKVEFCGGIALIIVPLVVSFVRRSSEP
jgi:hypothetical protein